MTERILNVLFLCTGNSAHSILAAFVQCLQAASAKATYSQWPSAFSRQRFAP